MKGKRRNRTKKEKLELMEKIQASYLARVPTKQFCEHYGISTKTYYIYLDKCMKLLKENFVDKQQRMVGYFIGSAMERIGELKRHYLQSKERARIRTESRRDTPFGLPPEIEVPDPKNVSMARGIPEIVERFDRLSQPDFELLDRIHIQEKDLFNQLQSMGIIPKAGEGMAVIGGAETSRLDEMVKNVLKATAPKKGRESETTERLPPR